MEIGMRDRVAVYGDSFADPNGHGHWDHPELEQYSWINLLGKKYDVTNFGKASSSVYYSYNEFLSSYEEYNKIVFLVTDEFRWFTPIRLGNKEICVNGLGTIDHFLDNYDLSQTEREELLFLRYYFLNTTFDTKFTKFSRTIINLMVEDVIQKCQQKGIHLLLLGIQSASWHPATSNKICVANYYELFWKNYFKDPSHLFENFIEKRTICHMSDTVNEVFANDVAIALETGVWDPVLPKTLKHHEPIDYYFSRNN
jgi:hypothetical protein